MGARFEEIEAKTLLRLHDTIDDWWWTCNSMNLYRGCEHACNYCDGRSHKYHIHEDFDETVQVKLNAPALLEAELRKLGFSSTMARDSSLSDFGGKDLGVKASGPAKFVVAVGGGVSDSYQPAERKYELTRKALEVLRDFELPVFIITKSDLVIRDMDILEDINSKTYANVSFTVTTMDEKVRKKFEPRATSSEGRLKALAQLRDRGIHGAVMLMPMIPYIADSEQSVDEVVRAAKASKAECVLFGTMSMRAEQKDRMFEILKCDYSGLLERFERLYRKGDWPDDEYTYDVYLKAHSICKKRGMPERVARYIPEGAIGNNLRVCEVLCNMAYFMQMKDIRIEKVEAYRKAGHSIDALREDIKKLDEEGRLLEVPGVGNVISKDIKEILKTGTCPLYEKLKE
jgi:DNA repair photolyase